jgi:GNAT superfamily N-acetyltransferase
VSASREQGPEELAKAPGDDTGLVFHPATEERWPDVEQVLGRRGGHNGCWCMRWRLPPAVFQQRRGEANRRALRSGLAGGRITAVLGYLERRPVSWCAVGPREQFPVLETSDLLARVDNAPVWSVACCYLDRACRGRGLASAVVAGAAGFARDQGARLLEAYPLSPASERVPLAAAWTGFESVFARAGFTEVARRAPLRPVFRQVLEPDDKGAGADSNLQPCGGDG